MTDQPERDPLEELREMREGLIDECSCVESRTCVPWDWWGLFDRAIAAWAAERERYAKLEAALRAHVEVGDEMSYHGEGLVCTLCGGLGSRAGFKSGVGDAPITHEPTCLLAAEVIAVHGDALGGLG